MRESLARAAFERKESGNGGNGGVGIGDGFLEVCSSFSSLPFCCVGLLD